MPGQSWDRKITKIEVEMSKNDILELLKGIYSDDDASDIVIELLDTNQRVFDIVKKWINEE